jgi:hypothetical protein
LAGSWPGAGRQLAGSRQGAGWGLAESWLARAGRDLADGIWLAELAGGSWPGAGWELAGNWPGAGRQLAGSRQGAGWGLAESWLGAGRELAGCCASSAHNKSGSVDRTHAPTSVRSQSHYTHVWNSSWSGAKKICHRSLAGFRVCVCGIARVPEFYRMHLLCAH